MSTLVLRDHQQAALDWLRGRSRGFLALPYGTGKTAPAILRAADAIRDGGRVLVVTTNGTVGKWRDEIKTWGHPSWKVESLTGKADWRRRVALAPHNVGIVNYEGVAVLLRLLGKRILGAYKMILFDEVHQLRNPDTAQSRVAAVLAHPDHADNVYGLTGSPVLESPIDLFGLFRAINPGVFGWDFEGWRDRYFVLVSPTPGAYPKWTLRAGCFDRLKSVWDSHSFRRERSECDVTMPDQRMGEPLICEMRGRTAEMYAQARDSFGLDLETGHINLANVYPRLEKLCQLSRGWYYDARKRPCLIEGGNQPVGDALDNYLDSIRGQGRVVVWSVRPPEMVLIREALRRHGRDRVIVIHGESGTTKQRHAAVKRFNVGGADALIAHPKCVGEGIDLSAEFSFRYSYRWSALEYDQSIGRLARMSSRAKWVHYTDAVVADSLDGAILDAIRNKTNLGKRVVERRISA